MAKYRERLDLLVFHACSSDLKRAAQFKQRLDALGCDHPTFDDVVELARDVFQSQHPDDAIVLQVAGNGSGRVWPRGLGSRSLWWPDTATPGQSALEALQAELARRKAAEPEPPAQVDSESSEELRQLREENRQLREIAIDAGGWQMEDGKWVRGLDEVYRPLERECAGEVLKDERDGWYSKPELAIAAAKGQAND